MIHKRWFVSNLNPCVLQKHIFHHSSMQHMGHWGFRYVAIIFCQVMSVEPNKVAQIKVFHGHIFRKINNTFRYYSWSFLFYQYIGHPWENFRASDFLDIFFWGGEALWHAEIHPRTALKRETSQTWQEMHMQHIQSNNKMFSIPSFKRTVNKNIPLG